MRVFENRMLLRKLFGPNRDDVTGEWRRQPELHDLYYRVILSLEAPNKFAKSMPEFGGTQSSVLGCERSPVSASVMSRSCFASFFFSFSFSSHYLNNIIFYRQ